MQRYENLLVSCVALALISSNGCMARKEADGAPLRDEQIRQNESDDAHLYRRDINVFTVVPSDGEVPRVAVYGYPGGFVDLQPILLIFSSGKVLFRSIASSPEAQSQLLETMISSARVDMLASNFAMAISDAGMNKGAYAAPEAFSEVCVIRAGRAYGFSITKRSVADGERSFGVGYKQALESWNKIQGYCRVLAAELEPDAQVVAERLQLRRAPVIVTSHGVRAARPGWASGPE